jgi:hypothetical protein
MLIALIGCNPAAIDLGPLSDNLGGSSTTTGETTGGATSSDPFAPSSGSTGVDPNIRITYAFGVDIDDTTLTNTTITLTDNSNSFTIPGFISYSSQTLSFQPVFALEASKSYTLNLSTNILTMGADPFEASDQSTTFNTADVLIAGIGFAETSGLPTLRGTCSTNAINVAATLNGAPQAMADSDCSNGNWSITPASPGVGTYTIVVSADSGTSSGTSNSTIEMEECAVLNAIGASGGFDGGTGLIGAPFLISTAVQLADMNQNVNEYYQLTADIDLSCLAWAPIGTAIGATSFDGNLDGDGFFIKRMTIENPISNGQSLLGYMESGSVSNIRLLESFIGDASARSDHALFITQVDGTVVNGAFITGQIDFTSNNHAGAIYSVANASNVSNLFGMIDLSGTGSNVGGILGSIAGGPTISNIVSRGNVYSSTGFSGGFAHTKTGGTVSDSYTTGHVSSLAGFIGGFYGWNNGGTTNRSYATGNVYGDDIIGGFVGTGGGATFIDCYASGGVNGDDIVGGFIGSVGGDTITTSYSLGTVTGNTNTDYFAASGAPVSTDNYVYQSGCAVAPPVGCPQNGAIGYSDSNMKLQASYVGFDFGAVWQNVTDGTTYPSHQ